MPHASIVVRIGQQVGGSAGVALLAVVLATAGTGAHAFDVAFWWATGFTGIATLLSFALPARSRPTAAGLPATRTSRRAEPATR